MRFDRAGARSQICGIRYGYIVCLEGKNLELHEKTRPL